MCARVREGKEDRKKIGILGGTFNPIHLGHLQIAYAALEQFHLDQVLFIPAGQPPHKDIFQDVSAWQRYEMVRERSAANRLLPSAIWRSAPRERAILIGHFGI